MMILLLLDALCMKLYVSVGLCQTVGSFKQTMIHVMTSLEQIHDISVSTGKTPRDNVSSCVLAKRKM